MTSFVQRSLRATITLGPAISGPNAGQQPTFPGGSNQVVVSGDGGEPPGYRMTAAVTKTGGRGLTTAQVRIFGLPLSLMNRLSTLGLPVAYYVGRNLITLEAGDAESGMAVVFQGTIYQAWADLDQQPLTAFNILAQASAFDGAAPAAPTSFPGPFDVATAMASFAERSNPPLVLENTGVVAKLPPSYFSGSLLHQIQKCAEAADVSYIVDNGKLAIWPKGQARGASIPLIAASASGSPGTPGSLVGYPRYTSQGVALRTLYTPTIDFGCKIEVKSSVTPANGTWVVFRLLLNLAAQQPDGPWFCDLEAARPQVFPQVAA